MPEVAKEVEKATAKAKEKEKDSTQNIARRYRHLFRLPSSRRSILYASIPVVLLELITRSVLGAGLERIILYAVATEILLLVTIAIDTQVLKRRSKIGSFRRIASISIISNMLWLVLGAVALLLYITTGSEGRFIALIIVGVFFAISFRSLVFGSVFYPRPIQGLPLAVVQPIILVAPIAVSTKAVALYSSNLIAALAGGVISVIAMQLYLGAINRTTRVEGFKPLQLLQAFLSAWTMEDAIAIERFLDIVSKENVVKTTIVRIDSDSVQRSESNGVVEGTIGSGKGSLSALLVVPGIHPGPFYPIGSSNLPADIYAKLRRENVVPLTVHSISDHDLNLPSRSEVQRFVSSLRDDASTIDQGRTMSLPVVRKQDKATVTGFALGSSVVIALTQAPYGMEDFPVSVRRAIEEIAEAEGFKTSFVIDTHNSEGAKPNEKECLDATSAAGSVIKELANAEQHAFRAGFAHSSELEMPVLRDIGPAGVGLLLFEIQGTTRFCFVIVDANNSKIGFREAVLERFERNTGSKILELCTSDTHVTAARTSDAKGYLALGDLVSEDEFARLLSALYERAALRVAEASFSTSTVTSRVKTIGSEVLSEFSGLLDTTSAVAKYGAQVLGLIAIAVTVVVAIV